MFARRLRNFAFASGWYARDHARRNRRRLTVVSFHRVLAREDSRAIGADPLWTLDAGLFREILDFLRAHYSPLTPEALLAYARQGGELPERPLLVTCDDGWRDSADTAAPLLAAAGLRGYLFVASAAIGRRAGFWQERLVAAARTGQVSAELERAIVRALDVPEPQVREPLARTRQLVRALNELTDGRRAALGPLLDEHLPPEPGGRQMIDAGELAALERGAFRIGSHGRTHVALDRLDDEALAGELRGSRDELAPLAGHPIEAHSFPFGRRDARVDAAARAAGYELLFSSAEGLNDFAGGRLPALLGRLDLPAHELTDARGRLAPERLAAWLFRRPSVGTRS